MIVCSLLKRKISSWVHYRHSRMCRIVFPLSKEKNTPLPQSRPRQLLAYSYRGGRCPGLSVSGRTNDRGKLSGKNVREEYVQREMYSSRTVTTCVFKSRTPIIQPSRRINLSTRRFVIFRPRWPRRSVI